MNNSPHPVFDNILIDNDEASDDYFHDNQDNDDEYLMDIIDHPSSLSRSIKATAVKENGGYTKLLGRSKSEGGILKPVESSTSFGSFLARTAFHFFQNNKEESARSKQRHRLNIFIGIALVVVTTLLIATLSTVAYYMVILPYWKERELDAAIRAQAALDAQLLEQCRAVTWQTACDALGGAGARRRDRLLQEVFPGDNDMTDEGNSFDAVENLEEQFLESDDPTVTYDPTCLRIYRLTMMWNITFPYRSSQLLVAGGQHTMALFIQHGALRDDADYFCSFKKLMLQQNYRPASEILIIAPHFQYGHDDFLHPRDAYWNTTKPWGDWRVGAESDPQCCGDSGRTVSSFNVLDYMLAILTNKQLYPNMNKISFLGHSAGGQMVQRYAVMSTLAALWDIEADIHMKFIIANPSSYTYLDNRRFQYSCGHCDCNITGCKCDQDCTSPPYTNLSVPTTHGVGADWPCYQGNYDRWPYGLGSFSTGHNGDFSIPYALRDGYAGVERSLRVYRKLDIVYIVGQNDTCNDGLPTCDESCWKREIYDDDEWPCFPDDMDTRCPAMLQGPCRRTRGYQYMNYLQRLYSHPTHTLWEIPGVGHDANAIFGSDIGMQILFDREV